MTARKMIAATKPATGLSAAERDATGRRRTDAAIYPVTAWSAMSRARSMTSKPSASCSSVMHSGGFVWIELFGANVYSPFSRKNFADRLHLVGRAVVRASAASMDPGFGRDR